MKQLILSFIMIISSATAIAENSRIRWEQNCSVQDSFNGQDITVLYSADFDKSCTFTEGPHELKCTINTSLFDFEGSTCFKLTEIDISGSTVNGRQIKKLLGPVKINTPNCSAATIPKELLQDISCRNYHERILLVDPKSNIRDTDIMDIK